MLQEGETVLFVVVPLGDVVSPCPSKSANDSGSSPTMEYKFSVCGLVRFAYGTATGTADQSELSQRPKRQE
jgi:hypothetical protein